MSIEEIIKLHNSCFDVVFEKNATCYKRKPVEEIEANRKKAMELINEKSREELLEYIIDNAFTKNVMEWN